METVMVSCSEALLEECRGRKVDIYGARTVAQRACYYLESNGVNVNSFVVSNRYENPYVLNNKSVDRIEENKKPYDCMVVAVSKAAMHSVEKELLNYDIQKIVIINPEMADDILISCCILSEKSEVSPKAFISDKVQIVTDDTSSVHIGDNAVIKEGAIILATNNSNIYIDNLGTVGRNVNIIAVDSSDIRISSGVSVGERCVFSAVSGSVINICDKTFMDGYCYVLLNDESEVDFEEENYIFRNADIRASYGARIRIGKKTTVQSCLHISADKADVDIGEDNMFSHYVKISTGCHKLIDKRTGMDITNRKAVKTGNHVWIGAGATLLQGCDVGNNSVVGASAVVTKNIEAFSACAGNPAKIIRREIDWER